MRYTVLFIFVILVFTACQKPATAPVSSDAKRYPFKGKVVSVDREKKKAKIDHDAIPGFMEAMTMDFAIREEWVFDNLTPGAEVRAELVVDSSADVPYWLEKIGIVALPNPDQPAVPVNEKFAQIGKAVPDFKLTDQNGKPLTFKDYRGKALAVTFIYRECPLPDYCIKMSQHFSDLANQVHDDAEAEQKIRLLSISFDPERDTPEKLKQYGLGYLGKGPGADFTIWNLAVGSDKEVRSIADFFGLRYEVDQTDKAQFNHSLRTAVVGPDGTVKKIFAGNEWTTDELLRELKAALE
ncbi:MAG: SCO family protein [Pyrinomonadaceae bacterium]